MKGTITILVLLLIMKDMLCSPPFLIHSKVFSQSTPPHPLLLPPFSYKITMEKGTFWGKCPTPSFFPTSPTPTFFIFQHGVPPLLPLQTLKSPFFFIFSPLTLIKKSYGKGHFLKKVTFHPFFFVFMHGSSRFFQKLCKYALHTMFAFTQDLLTRLVMHSIFTNNFFIFVQTVYFRLVALVTDFYATITFYIFTFFSFFSLCYEFVFEYYWNKSY